MTNYQHIIWDWNGTLLNDVWLSIEIVNTMLEKHNATQLDVQRYREVFDFPIIQYYQRIGFNFEQESFEDLCEQFISNYGQRVEECQLHRGARRTIHQLHEFKISQSVLSAAEQQLLNRMVDTFGVSRYLEKVSGLSDNYAASKVENGQRMIAAMGLRPEEVLLVGDTTHDYEVAEAIGVDCVLIAHGHHDFEKLSKHTDVVSNFDELVQYL
ncbi:MAG: HAD family hydrolase [Bacteroidota bacterium]